MTAFLLITLLAAGNPWEDWDNPGRGKGGGMVPVPEPATYGLVLAGAAAATVGWAKWRRKR